jgi:hypothetical protein
VIVQRLPSGLDGTVPSIIDRLIHQSGSREIEKSGNPLGNSIIFILRTPTPYP